METGSKSLIQGGNNQEDRFIWKTNLASYGIQAVDWPAGVKSRLSTLQAKDLNQSVSHPVLTSKLAEEEIH